MRISSPLRAWPSLSSGVSVPVGGVAWGYGSWVELAPAAPVDSAIAGILLKASGGVGVEVEIDIGIGSSGSELVISTFRLGQAAGGVGRDGTPLMLPVPVSGLSNERVSARLRASTTGGSYTLKVMWWDGPDNSLTTDRATKCLPTGSTGLSVTPSGASWVNSSWHELTASTPEPIAIYGISPVPSGSNDIEFELGIGASGSEVPIGSFRCHMGNISPARESFLLLDGVYPVEEGTRVSVRVRLSGTTVDPQYVSLLYYGGLEPIEPVVSAPGGVATGIGELTDYLEKELLDHVLGGATAGNVYTPPASVYVGLSTTAITDNGAVTEPVGNNYARVEIVNTSANWSNATGNPTLKQNQNTLTFNSPSGNWGDIAGYFIADDDTGGNVLMYCNFEEPIEITTGVVATILPRGILVEFR